MARVMLLLVMLLAVGLLLAVQPARAQTDQPSAPPATVQSGEYPNVTGVAPFTAASNFMSVPGYLRWQTFREQGLWISYAEARRIVIAQGGELYHRA